MNQDYPTIRRQVLEALDAGNAHDTFRLLRPVLAYPNQVADDTELTDALDLFSRIGETIAGGGDGNGRSRIAPARSGWWTGAIRTAGAAVGRFAGRQ